MAGRIPKLFIDDLLQRTDIVEIVDRRVPLKKAGKNYQACCPFHNEKTPSFSVSPDKQFYYCFGCGATGNALSFIMEYDRLDFVDAVEDLAQFHGVEVPREASQAPTKQWNHDPYELMEKVARFYQQQLRESANQERVVGYLKQRGLSGAIARDFGLGYAPDEWHRLQGLFGHEQVIDNTLVETGMLIDKEGKRYDRFRDRVMFPIRDRRGRVIAFGGRVIDRGEPKYLNSPETEIFHKGRELYGLYELRKANRKVNSVIVVEGYMDVVSLAQFGVKNAVATLGTATSSQHIQQLFRVCSKLIFCFDGDRAGRDAAVRALNQSIPHIRDSREIRFMFLPDGEDPDTQVRQIGAEAFIEQAENSQSLFDFLLKHLQSSVDMDTFEGPGKLANLAKPFVELMTDVIHRERFIETLAGQVGLSEAKLNQLLASQAIVKQAPQQTAAPDLPLNTVSQLTPVRRAITLLLHQSDLATEIEDFEWLLQLRIAGNAILHRMIEILRANPTISTGALFEYWRGHDALPHLLKLANEELLIPEEGMRQELFDIIKRLKQQFLEQMHAELTEKAKKGRLSADDKQQLVSILQQLK